MMMGMGTSGVEVQLPGVCVIGDPASGQVALSTAQGGFTDGLKSWFMNPNWISDSASNPNASLYGFNPSMFGSLFSATQWTCNPSYEIGVLIAPLAALIGAMAILKRRR